LREMLAKVWTFRIGDLLDKGLETGRVLYRQAEL
jgi:hypothetical protein